MITAEINRAKETDFKMMGPPGYNEVQDEEESVSRACVDAGDEITPIMAG